MKRLLLALPVLLVPLALWAGGPTDKDDPRKAIQGILNTQVAAWNKGDLEGFMAGYWKSPEMSFYSGKTKTRGWDETLARYRKLYQAEGKEMGKLAFSELAIDLIGPDHALVRGRWQL